MCIFGAKGGRKIMRPRLLVPLVGPGTPSPKPPLSRISVTELSQAKRRLLLQRMPRIHRHLAHIFDPSAPFAPRPPSALLPSYRILLQLLCAAEWSAAPQPRRRAAGREQCCSIHARVAALAAPHVVPVIVRGPRLELTCHKPALRRRQHGAKHPPARNKCCR